MRTFSVATRTLSCNHFRKAQLERNYSFSMTFRAFDALLGLLAVLKSEELTMNCDAHAADVSAIVEGA
jgi:hypothetical protein